MMIVGWAIWQLLRITEEKIMEVSVRRKHSDLN